MTQIRFEDLMEHVDSKYRLVMIAAKRAKQLNRGAAPLIEPRGVKPTYQALEEIASGKLAYEVEPLEGAIARELAEAAGKATWYRSLSAEEVAPDETTVEVDEVVEEEELPAPEAPVVVASGELLVNGFEEESLNELNEIEVDQDEAEE